MRNEYKYNLLENLLSYNFLINETKKNAEIYAHACKHMDI